MLTGKVILAVLAVAVVVGLALVVGALASNRVPLAAPPGLGERLRAYLTTNVAQTAPDAVFPELRPREIDAPADAVHALVIDACRSLGWKIASADPGGRTVAAVVVTPLLGFRDDVAIRVEALGPATSRVHVRSSSRVGRGDLGANLRHVLDLADAIARRQRDG